MVPITRRDAILTALGAAISTVGTAGFPAALFAQAEVNVDQFLQTALNEGRTLSPAAQAYMLRSASVEQLLKLERSEAVYRAILGRTNVPLEQLRESLAGLANMKHASELSLLLDLIEDLDAKQQDGGFAGLGPLLVNQPAGELRKEYKRLMRLASGANTADAQRLGFAAWITSSGDVDGQHISTLLLTLLFRFMRPLIENGHVFLAQPPLYKLKWQRTEPEFAYSDRERDGLLKAGLKAGKKINKDDGIQRYKGLGEMDAKELWETTMDPSVRVLRQVTLDDAAAADELFSILMGEDVEARRSFITRNAKDVRFLDV